MEGITLPKRLIKLQKIDHVNSVWLLEQEYFVDILEHYFVVVSLSVQFRKIAIKVKTIVTAWDQHGKILNTGYDRVRKLANISFGVYFILKVFCGSHFIIATFLT